METLFTCVKYSCTLTRRACAERRAARMICASRKHPTYPGCADCEQGERMSAGIDASHVKPTFPGQQRRKAIPPPSPVAAADRQNHQTQKIKEETTMAYPNKIDNEQLKKMLAEGKYIDEISKEIGVTDNAVRTRIKHLGMAVNYRRQPRQADRPLPDASCPLPGKAESSKPEAENSNHEALPDYRRFAPSRPIPVTLESHTSMTEPARVIPVTLQLTVEISVRCA